MAVMSDTVHLRIHSDVLRPHITGIQWKIIVK